MLSMKLLHPHFLAAALSLAGLPVDADALLPSQASAPSSNAALAAGVVSFWREAGPSMWFAKDPEFDRNFRDKFLSLHEAAARGDLAQWKNTAEGTLALIILLDQFPRNAFRNTARMYATDAMAVDLASHGIAKRFDMELDTDMRLFMYLPFGHSENLQLQERSVLLSETLGPIQVKHARGHRDIIKRFGRFPHRNPILGRPMRVDEQKFLDEGGFAG